MPVYDYVCGDCGHLLEVIHGIHAEGPRFCPSCGAEGRMTKAFNAPAVVFKGSGWAKKDRRVTASSTKSRTDSSSSDASSSDSKPGASDSAASTSAGGSSDSRTSSGSGSGSGSGAAASSSGGAD